MEWWYNICNLSQCGVKIGWKRIPEKGETMAIQFNLNALSRFSNVNFGDNDAIANLDGGNGLVGSS